MARAKRNDADIDPPPRKGGCLKRLLVAALLLGAIGLGAGTAGFLWLEARLPDVFSFEAYRKVAREHSRAFAAGGEMVARFGTEIRTVVPIDQIPETVLYAVVCAEDASFFHHPGLDLLGIARALWVDVTRGRYVQGASTITQQFAKTRFLSNEKTITRKLKELVMARKLEQKLSKHDILAMYVNEIYFGHGRYGVEEAARFYFGKPVSQVDIAEAAMLAAVVNAPSRFSPLRHPDRARKRRQYVLEQMHSRGYISAQDAARAQARPLPTQGHGALAASAPYYLREVRREVIARVGAGALSEQGLRVEVALDLAVQQAADRAVARGLRAIDRHDKVAHPVRRYEDKEAMNAGLDRLTRQRQGQPAASGRPTLGVVRGHDRDRGVWLVDLGGERANLPESALERYRGLSERTATAAANQAASDRPADRLAATAPAGAASEDAAAVGDLPRFEPGDLIRVSVSERSEAGTRLVAEFGPQAALIALEPGSRLVRAMVGGDDFGHHPFNRARRALRQPGSTFKTFVYGAALEAGIATPDTEVADVKRTHISYGRPWVPRNYTGDYDGQPHSLRDALARSINSIAVEMADRVTPPKVAEFARRVGIRSPLSEDLPLALGASSVTPEELANAYATLAADGQYAEPIYVTRIVDRFGREVFVSKSEPKRVISSTVSRALTDMLGEVVRRGSGRKADVGRPVAGKTGTSNRGRDNWFVGFSPRLCAAVWVGYDDRKPIAKGTGGTLALPIWSQFMREALDRVPVLPLPRLPHVAAAVRAPPSVLPMDPEAGAGDLEDGRMEAPAPGAAQAPGPEPIAGEIIDEAALEAL